MFIRGRNFGGAVVLALGLSSPAWAQLDLHRMEERLGAARERLLEGASPDEVRSEMRALRAGYAARVERLQARLDEAESRIHELALGPLAAERLARARAALESSHLPLLEGLERLANRPDPLEIEECLRMLEPLALATREDILGQELPLRAPELSPQPIQKSGITDTESFAAAGAPDAPVIGSVPESLRRIAEGLDGAVAVYELVKNETRFELYSGFMKGAEQTLLEKRGNDADINALLVSLLRAKGIPARFVRGVVRLPVDRAMNLFGVERPDRVEQALFAAAVPYEPVFSGSGLSAIEVERVWAEAYLPYSNYRGTALDDQGLGWVPLDASFKFHTLETGLPVLEDMGFDAEAFLREAFRADPLFDPLAEIRQRVEEHLAVQEPGTSFEEALRRVVSVPEVYGILPARLPYEVVSVNGVSFDPPAELEHGIRFRAVNGAGQVFLDARFPASRLLGRRLTLSYTPATAEDQRTADAFGGLYRTPPFLVEVRPVVRSGGLVVASGSAIGMGLPFELRVSFQSPGGVVDFENRMIAGAFAAIALSGRGPTFEESSETRAGEILSQRALNYLARWNDADDELAGLARVVNLRPIPSHVMVKNRLQVEYAEGDGLVPIELLWKGIDVDSDLRPSAPIAAEDDDSARRTFLLLSGLVGSELESRVLEDDLGVASISTSKLLRLAGTLGVALREIDSTNVDVELPALGIEPALKEAIEGHVHRGRVVTAPATDVAFLAWTGAGFVALDLETGESAYMLSGAIAGGSSAVSPAEYADEVAIALRDPSESGDVPSRLVARISKFASSDFQEGVVTTELERPLEVWVTDEDGNPVEDGVPVRFRVLEPGLDALLSSMDLSAKGEAIVVATKDGIARVRFRLGKTTRFRPRFTRVKEGDPFVTQVGVYSVTAESGGVSLVNPFLAFALPDRAGGIGGLRHLGGGYAKNMPLIVDSSRLAAEIVDRFQNPLSNITVTYRVGAASRIDSGPLPTENFVNAKLLTDAGEQLDQVFSTGGPFGVGGVVRLGNTDNTRFTIVAELEGKTLEFYRDSHNFGSHLVKWPVGERLGVFFSSRGIQLPSGKRLWLGRAGERLPGRIHFSLIAYQEDYEVVRNENTGKYELEGKGTFTQRWVNEAVVTPVFLEGTGVFEPREYRDAFDGGYPFQLYLGKEAGRRRIDSQVEAKLFRPVVDRDTGVVSIADFRQTQGVQEPGFEVWGATVRLLEQVPNPIFVDGNGHVEAAASLPYEILPAEVDAMLQTRVQGRVIRLYEQNALYAENDLPPLRVDISPNVFFDTTKVYEAEIVLLKDTFFELRSDRSKIRFFTASLDRSDPRPILARRRVVDGPFLADGGSFQYFVEPSSVSWDEVRVAIVAVDRKTSLESIVAQIPGTTVEGAGEAVLPAGANVPVDLEAKEYRAELLLRQGDQFRRGAPLFNPFARLLYDVSPKVSVEVEVTSGAPCVRPGTLAYRLSQPAEVLITATFGDVERVLFRGVRDPATTAPDPLVFVLSDPTVLPFQDGKYPLRIHARAVNEELEEEFIAQLTVNAKLHNVLPVGHTFVKGVDLLDGHLVASSTDVSIPGRGPALEFVRTYSSSGTSDDGPLGAGWSMNYFSTLVVTGCSWMVVGGDGSGQRFLEEGGRFVPQKGYHTELVENSDGSFDFFTKGRIRYRYRDVSLFQDEPKFQGRPTLEFIEDTNGNRVEVVYDSNRNIIEAREVFAGGAVGRSLLFTYQDVRGVPRVSTVTGPLGLLVRYEYDTFANLIRVTRGERVESYEYTTGHPLEKHNLVAYTDPNGNTTRYDYYDNLDLLLGVTEDLIPFEIVRRVREPEGVATSFMYDASQVGENRFRTTVTDGLGNDTVYTLNLNGSPIRIEEPRGVVTEMEWSPTDIFKTKEVDANLRVTDFVYDANGNLTLETIRAGGPLGDVVTEFEYHPVFNKMTLKRVHNVDAEGNPVVQETHFVIHDTNGNLERVIDADGKMTEYRYRPNGDLELVLGPRPSQVTSFTYDDFGNPATTTDGVGNVTTTVYDARSRLRSSTDTLGRSMAQEFDELDRVTSITRTDASGASDEAVILREYYPGGQLRSETNGLGLTTSFFLDGLNRVTGTLDSLGLSTTTRYDPNGNVTERTDRRGVTTASTYDELNRLVRVDVSGRFGLRQTVARMDYDKVGNKLFEVDLHGSRTDFGYDRLYRVTSRQLPTGHTETFAYDRVGNKLLERDANGKPTELAYDRLNRLVFRKDAENNRMTFAYDEVGNQTRSTDVTRGLETRTTYDFLNRPLSRVVEGSGANAFLYETTFEYFDPEHRMVETDPRGFQKTTLLDGFDRVREVRQETGAEELVTRSFYDANGNLKTTVDAENRTTRFRYDGLNRLEEVEDAIGRFTRFEYDGEGNKTREVDRRGVPRTFAYDNLGRLVRTDVDQILSGKGRLTLSQTVYTDALRRRQEIDARGHSTTFEMDRLRRVTSITDADGKVQRFEYDGVNKVAEIDKKGRRTEFVYDGINRLTTVRDPLGQTIRTTYLDSQRQVLEVDKRGIEKTTQLDALGRLVSVTRSGVVLEQHAYDGNNNRTISTDANENRTRFTYDGANRLTERTDAFEKLVATTTRFRYDRVGNLLEEKDGRDTGEPFDVRNTYDFLNRLETTEDGEGNVTRFEYDAEGNRTAQVEPKSPGHRTEFRYGELNELLEVRMADRGIYRYDYDPNRNRTEQRDGNDKLVRFAYDKLNRMQTMNQDPGGLNLVTRHEYDANGNETRLTDPKGQVIDFGYDELNRLKFKNYNLTPADLALFTRTHRIDYEYDPNDNLVRIDETKSSGTDPPATVSSFKTFDSLDRLESETDAWGRRLGYGYDRQGNRTLLIDPDNKRTTYAYDALNRLQTLTFNDLQVVRYEYFPDGLKRTVTNPNGTISTYRYDAADRTTDITHTGPTGIVSQYQYTYDANGNRLQQIETNAGRTETTTYDYDLVNRLTSATYPEKTVTYEYDPAGNRTRETTTGAGASDKVYAYDAINRLLSIDSDVDTEDVSYQYDPNGNTTQKTKAGVTTTFHYDIRDQLGEVRESGNVLGRYGYDYNGRRILKIGNEGRRQYTYDQLSVITEADPANATVSKYDYGLDQLVRLDNRSEGRSFFHLDVIRSTVSLTDPAGGARQSIFYDAWGNERERVGASANKFTFTGHEKDEETGLIYAKARFYDPDVGRFLSQDSLLGQPPNPPSLHRYFYAKANPLKFVDLTGHESMAELVLLTQGDPRGKPLTPEELAFGGAVKGFGEVIASPGVFTYHLTGAWIYQRTGDEAYRHQFEVYTKAILPRMQEALSSPEAFVRSIGDSLVTQRRRYDEAMDRGDVEEAAAALANFTGQLFTVVEGARTGPAIPFRGPNQFAPALAEGVATTQSGAGVLTMRGAGLPGTAGIIFSESVTEQGASTSKKTDHRVQVENAEGTTTGKPASRTQAPPESPREVVIRFKSKGDADEFARQLAGQESGLNRKTVGEIRQNIERFRKEGRPPEADAAIRRFRRENPDAGGAVLHEPDCCIGGGAEDIGGVGGRSQNASLGAQNRIRQQQILDEIQDLPDDASVRFRFVVEENR